ncbi:MAG: hypothetical protein LWW94_06365 [Candidatus Desulfofervidaceae bacterium]|nr:hypothetical protein [Candidatus Desulfofervidaceae bacterium]
MAKSWILEQLQTLLATPQDLIKFAHTIIGCQCSDEVLKEARVYFAYRPLLDYFLKESSRLKRCPHLTQIEQTVNLELGLPQDLQWPRNKKGYLRHPKSWTRKFLIKNYPEKYIPSLLFLRKLVFVEYEAVVDVPERAFFLIKASPTPFSYTQIEKAYVCGNLLTHICCYNRFRLITITRPKMAVGLDKIDRAISWHELGVKDGHCRESSTN